MLRPALPPPEGAAQAAVEVSLTVCYLKDSEASRPRCNARLLAAALVQLHAAAGRHTLCGARPWQWRASRFCCAHMPMLPTPARVGAAVARPHQGSVELDLTIGGTTLEARVSPLLATLLLAFRERQAMTAAELSAEVRRGLAAGWWPLRFFERVGMGVWRSGLVPRWGHCSDCGLRSA